MIIGDNRKELNMKLNNEKLEQVEVYKYIRAKVEREGSTEKEANVRLTNTSRIYHSLSKSL